MPTIQPNKYTLELQGSFIKVSYTNGKDSEYYHINQSTITKDSRGHLVLCSTVGSAYIHLDTTLIDGEECNPQIRVDSHDNMYQDVATYFNASSTAVEAGTLGESEFITIEPNTIRSISFSNQGEMAFVTGYFEGEPTNEAIFTDIPLLKVEADGNGLISTPILIGCYNGRVSFCIVKPQIYNP